MAKTQYLTYTVNLTDQARVDELNALYPDGLNRAPYNPGPPAGGAAVEFAEGGVTLPVYEQGDATGSPGLTSPWFDSSNSFPRDVAVFTLSGGWWIFGSSTKFYWIARFAYTPSRTADTTVEAREEAAPFPLRYAIDGIELNAAGEDPWNDVMRGSRAGSHWGDGFGWRFADQSTSARARGHVDATADVRTKRWDRFYVIPRRFATEQIYEVNVSSAVGAGFLLYLTASGQISYYTATSGSASVLQGVVTTPLVIGRRYRLDVITVATVSGSTVQAQCYLFLDGALVATMSHTPGGSAIPAPEVNQVYIGRQRAPSIATIAEIDYDDWRSAAVPLDKDPTTALYSGAASYNSGDYVRFTGPWPAASAPAIGFEVFRCGINATTGIAPRSGTAPYAISANWTKISDSLDWLNGCRIVAIQPTGAVGMANWTGDWRMFGQPWINDGTGATVLPTSSTSGATVQLTTNALRKLPQIPGAIGWGSLAVGSAVRWNSASVQGRSGYKIGGAAAVMTASFDESQTFHWNTALYPGDADTVPLDWEAIEIIYEKGADSVSVSLKSLVAVVEVIGQFGPEDQAPGTPEVTPAPGSRGLHNAPYYDTPWFLDTAPPLSPVVIQSGTYVGNSLGQDLAFPAPVHWLFIRPLTSVEGGAQWLSSLPSALYSWQQGAGHVLIPEVLKDPSFVPGSVSDDQQMRFLVRIGAFNGQVNLSGTTYQYVAFMDPGARFLLCGATAHVNNSLPVTEALENPDFAAEYGFFFKNTNSQTTTLGATVKSLGMGAAEVVNVTGAVPTAAAVSWAAGTLTFDSGYITSTIFDQYSYALFRRADGNADAGQPAVMVMGSYTGDGAASRTIGISPITGKRPLWLLVTPHAAATAYYRDPSHTGVNSQSVATGVSSASTTALTAGGIDSFTVGSTLNTNGVVYSWFGFVGSEIAGNGGWSGNGTFTPVAADSPADGDWMDPPDEFEDTPVGPEEPAPTPTAPDDIATDLAGACLIQTTRIVNLALSRIGVSKPVTDLAADVSQAATLARLHYGLDVLTVLEDFSWPFAKRYATLTLVAGAEDAWANDDWVYAFRAPTDMVAPRRVVGLYGEARAWDPNPVLWEKGSDASGTLIYANVINDADQVVLEYTARPPCVASAGDGKFRSALAWRLAASLALPLARDREKAVFCQTMYDIEIADAKVNAANQAQKPPGGDAEWITGRN